MTFWAGRPVGVSIIRQQTYSRKEKSCNYATNGIRNSEEHQYHKDKAEEATEDTEYRTELVISHDLHSFRIKRGIRGKIEPPTPHPHEHLNGEQFARFGILILGDIVTALPQGFKDFNLSGHGCYLPFLFCEISISRFLVYVNYKSVKILLRKYYNLGWPARPYHWRKPVHLMRKVFPHSGQWIA
jgi:hypothetical protein